MGAALLVIGVETMLLCILAPRTLPRLRAAGVRFNTAISIRELGGRNAHDRVNRRLD